MRTRLRSILLAAGLGASALPVRAQSLDERAAAFGGVEARSLSFELLPAVRRIRQISVPVGVALPFGRFSVDLGSSWASTILVRRDGTSHTVSNITDTQIRAAYVFGSDAVVATLAVNLPTGPESASPPDYSVIGAVSTAFLAFPTPVYASGFSVTGGLATAIAAGDWSLGLAGSIRASEKFTPYEDLAGPITYKPGVEGRLRAGADGLIGSSRLTLGVTWSSFGTDQFGAGGAGTGQYQPGRRLIVEGALVSPIGGSTISLTLWNFHRAAGDTSQISVANKENLAGGTLAIGIPLSPGFVLEPQVAGRLSNPESGSGRWIGAGSGFRIRLSDGLSMHAEGRYDWGYVKNGNGLRSDLSGWYGSTFLRAGL
ncbi:MAG: hypothetical protein ACRENB_00950 [Gemmatimonadales bacterium]